ncbi:hypothetical protein MK489_02820 [Myxococcota bacterium]|nr:hypothetical protein [Myxococcota bacterium]
MKTASNEHRSRWLEVAIAAAYVLLAGAAALFLPSFEGPDEPEHARHVEAWALGATPELPFSANVPDWGYQAHQPPLYYLLAGAWAHAIEPEFHDALVVNPHHNEHFPFLRHDLPEERFPFGGANAGLRWLRAMSVGIGLLTALLAVAFARQMLPDDPSARAFYLAVVLLAPNAVQLSGVVGNDGLSVALALGAFLLLAKALDRDTASVSLLTGCGIALGLAVATKLSAGISALAVGCWISMDAVARRRPSFSGTAVLATLLPFSAIMVALAAYYSARFGEVTWGTLVPEFFSRSTPLPTFTVLLGVASRVPENFAADLCWHSCGSSRLGHALFWPWLGAALLVAGMTIRHAWRGERFRATAWLGPMAAVLALMFATALNRNFSNFQIRHSMSLWPLIVLPFGQLLVLTRRSEWKWGLATTAAATLATAGAVLFLGARSNPPPISRPELDRDYRTFIAAHLWNKHRAAAYLRHGSFLGYDLRVAFLERNWTGAVALYESSEDSYVTSRTMSYYAASLAQLGRSEESLALFERLPEVAEEARVPHLRLVHQLGGSKASAPLFDRYLAETRGRARAALLRFSKALGTGDEIHPSGPTTPDSRTP